MHPHQTSMVEWVAVLITEGTFGGGSNVGEDEGRGRLGSDALEVDAVPRGGCRCEDTRLGAKFGVGIVSNSKSVTCKIISMAFA